MKTITYIKKIENSSIEWFIHIQGVNSQKRTKEINKGQIKYIDIPEMEVSK